MDAAIGVAFALLAIGCWLFVRHRRQAPVQHTPVADEEPNRHNQIGAQARRIGTVEVGSYKFRLEAAGPWSAELWPQPLPARDEVPSPAYLMEYANADGEFSTRVVAVRDVERRHGELYLIGYCYLAGGKRTFRADRILSLRNYHTGAKADPDRVESDLAAARPPETQTRRRLSHERGRSTPTFVFGELRKNPAVATLTIDGTTVQLTAKRLKGEQVALVCSCPDFVAHGLCLHALAALSGEVGDLDYSFVDIVQGTALALKAEEAEAAHRDFVSALSEIEDLKPANALDVDYFHGLSDASDETSKCALAFAIVLEELRQLIAAGREAAAKQ
jgi:WYL domain/SWIM zinc finger